MLMKVELLMMIYCDVMCDVYGVWCVVSVVLCLCVIG